SPAPAGWVPSPAMPSPAACSRSRAARARAALPLKRVLKAAAGSRRRIQRLDKGARLPGAKLPVHGVILPLHGQGARVADVVEGPDDRLEVDAAPARRAEIPSAAGITEGQVRGENPRA